MNAALFITGILCVFAAKPVAFRLLRTWLSMPVFLALTLGGVLLIAYSLAEATA